MINISKYRPFPAYESHEEAQSDHCLNCHKSYRGALVRKQMETISGSGRYTMQCLYCFNFVIYDLISEVEQEEKEAAAKKTAVKKRQQDRVAELLANRERARQRRTKKKGVGKDIGGNGRKPK